MHTFTLAFISTLSLSVHAASISDPISHIAQHNRQFHNADYVSESFEPASKINHRQVNAPAIAPGVLVNAASPPKPPVIHHSSEAKARVKLNAMFKKPKTVARGPAFAVPAVGLPLSMPALPVPALPVPALPVPALPVPALPVPALPVPALPVPALPVPALPAPAPPVPAVPIGHGVIIPTPTKVKIGAGAKLKIKDNTHQPEKDKTHQPEQQVNRLTNNAALNTVNTPTEPQVAAPVQAAVNPVTQRPVAAPPAELDEPLEKSLLNALLADLDLSLFSLSGNTKNEEAHQFTHEDTIKRQVPEASALPIPDLPVIGGTNSGGLPELPAREDSMDFSDDQMKDLDLSEYEAEESEDFEERF